MDVRKVNKNVLTYKNANLTQTWIFFRSFHYHCMFLDSFLYTSQFDLVVSELRKDRHSKCTVSYLV